MKITSQKKVLISTGLSLALRVIGAAAALIFQYVLARKAGVTGTGAYYFTISIVLVLATVGRLGLDKVIPKYIAVGVKNLDTDSVKNYVMLSCLTVLVTSTAVALLFHLIVTSPVVEFVNSEFQTPLRRGSLVIVLVSMLWLLSGLLVGIRESSLASIVQTVLTPVVGIIYITLIADEVTGEEAVLAFGLGALVSMISGFVFIRNRFGQWWKTKIVNLGGSVKIVSSAGLPIMLSNLSAQFTIYLPLLLLGIMGTVEETGMFAVAQRTALATTIVLFASNVVLAPRVASMWSNGERDEIATISQLVALVMLLVSLPLFYPMIFHSVYVMGLFGKDFTDGSMLLVVIAVSQLVNVATSSIGVVMTMTGYEKQVMNTSFLATVTCGVVCIALIPVYGAMGAAIGSALSTVLLHTSRVYVFFKGTGIVVVPFYKIIAKA